MTIRPASSPLKDSAPVVRRMGSTSDGNYMGLRPEAAHHYGFDYAPPILSKDEFASGRDRGVETLTQQALEFIERNHQRPWFCFLSHHMIHGEVVAPDSITRKYRAQGFGSQGPNRAVYLAGLECIDRSIGRLTRRLEELGLSERTLVLFLSDNGGIDERLDFGNLPHPHPLRPAFGTDLREYDNAPLRAGKGSIYEGGVRVPFIARWPSQIPPGAVIQTPVHAIDILPTCCAVAGASIPHEHIVDGESLVALMRSGRSDLLRTRSLFQYYPFYDLRWGLTPAASIRFGDHKLIEFFGDRVDASHIYSPGHHIELFNLRTDLSETVNLANSEKETVEMLRNKLHNWLKQVAARIPDRNEHWDVQRAFTETRSKPAWMDGVVWPTTAE